MPNIVFTRFFERAFSGNLNWASAVVRCLLERSTSTLSPNKDLDYVSDLTGLVEISVASYARQTLANKSIVIDDANDRIELDCDDLAFGNLETGQTARALIFYIQTGGNDSTPADDALVLYIDTATGLPATLGGGAFSVQINAEGLIQIS